MTSDLFLGGQAANLQQRAQSATEASLSTIAGLRRDLRPQAATETQTIDAVQAADDAVAVGAQAENAADIQAILDRLTQNTGDAGAVVDALNDLSDFADTQTDSQFAGSVLGQLADIADTLIGAIEADPAGLEQSFAFSFSANFEQLTQQGPEFFSEQTSLDVSFSINTTSTSIQGDLSFDSSVVADENGFLATSQENVTLRGVTFDANPQTNPLFDQFVQLTEEVTGVDVGELLGLEEAPELLGSLPQSELRDFPVFQDFFERLNQITGASNQTSELLDALRERLTPPDEEVSAA